MSPAAAATSKGIMSASTWTQRLPRKPREDKKVNSIHAPASVQARPARMTQKRKRGIESMAKKEDPPRDCRFSELTDAQAQMAKRLRIGQVRDLRLALSAMSLFALDADTAFGSHGALGGDQLRPRRGLQANWCGVEVHILDTFMCHRVFRADVAEMKPHRQRANCRVLGAVHTVRADELQHLRLDFLLTLKNGSAVLEALGMQVPPVNPPLPLHESGFSGEVPAEAEHFSQVSQKSVVIEPSQAKEHVAWAAKYGFTHKVLPENRRTDVSFLLDLPLPRPFVAQAYRCSTCRHGQLLMDHVPLQDVRKLPPAATQTYFVPTVADIKARFPEALVCKLPREAPVYFTKPFFFHIAQNLYETFNVRSVRRHIVSTYAAHALAEAMRLKREGHEPYSLAWQLCSVPHDGILRGLLLKGLAPHMELMCKNMQQKQFLHNSKGIRVDGNFDLAKIIRVPEGQEAFTAVLGICGLDGSLLVPFVPVSRESLRKIQEVLAPIFQDMITTFLEHGYALEDAVPVFLSTDNYRAHRLGLTRLCHKAFEALRVETEGDTPKGPVRKRTVDPFLKVPTIITADPQHRIIKMRALVSCHSNDGQDFLFDFIDCVNRLSAPLQQQKSAVDEERPPQLGSVEKKMLTQAVRLPKAKFDPLMAESEDSLGNLKLWMGHSTVGVAPEWQQLFGAFPPRGTLARIARRLQVELHANVKGHGWGSPKEFCLELTKLNKWYATGKKSMTRRRGIRRGHKAGPWRSGRPVVLTKKIRKQLKLIGSGTGLEGLWNWRSIASHLQTASIPVQTGTVAVERLWANAGDFYPDAANNMALEWWSLLSQLTYVRFNYRHFNQSSLPNWCRGDSLLAQRLDALTSLARALSEDQDTLPAISALQATFETAAEP